MDLTSSLLFVRFPQLKGVATQHEPASLRVRQVIRAYEAKERMGTYWGIRVNIADYGLPDSLPCPVDKTIVLAELKTRLKRLDAVLQERLINWRYAACDAAMRKWVDGTLSKPSGFPYPAAGIG